MSKLHPLVDEITLLTINSIPIWHAIGSATARLRNIPLSVVACAVRLASETLEVARYARRRCSRSRRG